jgi:hypothetical protein
LEFTVSPFTVCHCRELANSSKQFVIFYGDGVGCMAIGVGISRFLGQRLATFLVKLVSK